MATAFPTAPELSLPTGRSARHASLVPVYLAVALGYLLLVPPQFYAIIGSSVIPPYRMFLIAGVLFVVARAINGAFRFGLVDLIVTAASFWIGLALFMTTEATEAFTAVVAQTSDILLAYFFARAAFRNLSDLRIFLILMAPGLIVTGAIMAIESVTRQLIIQDLAGQLTGRSFRYRSALRMGLLRAPGPFQHPILAGIFMASFLVLYVMSGLRGWPKFAGIVASFCSVFSMSSAALLAMTAGTGLVAYNWISERIVNLTWRMFFFVSGLLYLVLELGTGSGAYNLLVRYGSLNTGSAYNRVLIWKYGSENVKQNPWFGIGYAEWDRPEWLKGSVDHFWLNLAIQFGVLPSLLVVVAVVLAVIALMRASMRVGVVDARALRGVAIALAVFAFGGMSVNLWLSAAVWFFVLLGLSVSLAAQVRPERPAQTLPHPRQDRLGSGARDA